jgi:hypothetical protein
MDAADRFRAAVDRRDVDGMAATLAPEVSLRSPTIGRSVEGRERARMIFQILVELFEDFEYTHALAGAPTTGDPAIASTRALVFRCQVGAEPIEGVDVFDIDQDDQIAVLTVFVRPLTGLQALGDAVAARLAQGPRAPD